MVINAKKILMSLIMMTSLLTWILNVYINLNVLQARKLTLHLRDQPGTVPMKNLNDSCIESKNFVFIKCMKCATETMGTILRRFGYVRDLNFVLPVKHNIYLGWPYPLDDSHIRPSKYSYNILMEHSIYNYTVMSEMMPEDVKFMTIIRNPWEHFKSTFNYFDIGRIAQVPNSSITEYLENIEHYERKYGDQANGSKRPCIPDGFPLTRNLLSHCLGMPLGFPEGRKNISATQGAVQSYINNLDETFSLVMIADYFVESLILLRRKMCWSFKDIIYHHCNVGNYKNLADKALLPEGKYYEIHKRWSHVDYMLFDHLNATFWNRIDTEGPGFWEEVEHFRLIQLLAERFCFIEGMWQEPLSWLHIPESRFGAGFNITGEDCVLMNTYMLPVLWARYYEREKLEPENISQKPNIRGCSI